MSTNVSLAGVIASVTSAGRQAAKADIVSLDAIRAAADLGNDALKKARDAFWAGYVAQAMNLPGVKGEKAAAALLKKGGATSKKADKRTPEEDRAYDAARAAWSRLTAKVGVRVEGSGGKGKKKGTPAPKGKGKKAATAPKAPKPFAVNPGGRMPTLTSAAEMHSFLVNLAAIARTVADKNAAILDAESADIVRVLSERTKAWRGAEK